MLNEIKELLFEGRNYIDNTHGYDTELFEEVKDFLKNGKDVNEGKELLEKVVTYIDNTHGYDCDLFSEINNFLKKEVRNKSLDIFN